MDLTPYVESLQQQLTVAAGAGGEEARAIADRLVAPLDAAARLTLLDALSFAVDEITTELAPGSVELRLRGREPEFVVTPPAADADRSIDEGQPLDPAPTPVALTAPEGDEGAMSRINLRLPDHLKVRIEQAAGVEGLSVNAWLVRAAADALQRATTDRQRAPRPPLGGQRYTGWAR